MNNPWLHLPHAAPFILPEDADSVAKFNERCHPDKKIHTELPPDLMQDEETLLLSC